ncbi:MAG: hypothetical protein JWR80_6969 [Bradyrhizobium sp.]|nr:hypothetical protein [Bradyrhizobium sp.]
MPSFALRQNRLTSAITGATAAVVGTVVLTNFVRIFSSAILTRLLSSADYGVIGIITSITYIIVMLSDFGFFAFLVRHKDGDDERLLDEVWTIRLIRSAGITILLILLAQPYAVYSGKPILAPVIAVWAFNQLLDGCASLAFAQAVRNGQVARLSWMEFGVNLFQVGISIAAAWWLRSYWSIVIAVLLGGAVKVFLSYALFPGSRRRLSYSRARAREIWSFSRFIAGSSILSLLLGQTDKVVLSRALPLAIFGIYSIATLLALAPRAVVYPYCTRVLYPAYAKQFREAAMSGFSAVYYGRRRLVSLLYMLVMGGVIGGAPLLVAILYDPRYAGVAPLLRIIAISAMLLLNNVAAEQAMVATGKSQVTLHLNLARFAWLAMAGFGGFVVLGPIGLIWAVGTIEVIAMLYCWFVLSRADVLNLAEESMALGAGAIGVAASAALSSLILSFGLL